MPILKDFYEKREWESGNLVCGIDEVGRGCLAGPLVVSAVILYPNVNFRLLKDSKILTKEELNKVCPKILENSWHSFAIINNLDIDRFNIWHATILAMKQAIINLFNTCPQIPKVILIDAIPLNLKNTVYKNIEIYSFAKGESLSRSIAAASIIAKVKRDKLMETYDKILPGYHFDRHKGYGTKDHDESLINNGKSLLHRNSYLKNFENKFNKENKQINIFDNYDK